MKKYGIFIGRFQPFHLGHQAVVNEILLDGLTPILVFGSSQIDRNMEKNPLSFNERIHLIDLIYPNTLMKYIYNEDDADWSAWYATLITDLVMYLEDVDLKDNCIIYYNEKEVDKTSFTCLGKNYTDTWYTDIFKDAGFETQKIKFADRTDITIDSNARDIRHDLEGNKHLLDARIYRQLKQWGWK
jgi:nicotinamide mononucleotide adenylyltransferase